MCRHRTILLATAGLLLLCCLTACAPNASVSDQTDEKNPWFQKAKKMYQAHDYKQAEKYYRKVLDQDPNNAAAHLELGLLYEDKLQDYAYAIYHYRRYMDLRPNAEKASLVKQFADRAMLSLAASVPNSPLEAGDEIKRLRQDNSNLLQQVEYLTQSNQTLEQKVSRFSRPPDETPVTQVVTQLVYVAMATNVPVQTQAHTNTVATNGPTAHSSTPTAHSSTATGTEPAAKPKTYVVTHGDTLSAISQKVYGRRDKWQSIYTANRSVIGPPPSYRLKVGQTLTIPKI